MKLDVLTGTIPGQVRIVGDRNTEIQDICIDSRKVKPGDQFICTPGLRMDAHSFAPQAVQKGAAALLVERVLDLDVPQVAVLVIVEEADVPIDFGSVTAAPFAREILEQTLMYLGIAPQTQEREPEQVRVPQVTGMNLTEAASAVKEAGLDCVFDGDGGIVKGQLPAAGAEMTEGSLMLLYVDTLTEISNNDKVTVPDVAGLSVLEAHSMLRSSGLKL